MGQVNIYIKPSQDAIQALVVQQLVDYIDAEHTEAIMEILQEAEVVFE